MMTVRDLIQQDIDIDVYDDVCEELGVAFCGPQKLTEEGKKEFSDVLAYPVHFNQFTDCMYAIVEIDDPDDAVWEKRLERARLFFEGMAGYCSCSDYDKWFEND